MEEDADFKRIQEICAPFELHIEQLMQIKNQMLNEINSSAETETDKTIRTSLKCRNTFIQYFPHGCEHGRYLVVNLEDTNITIYLYQLRGQNKPSVQSEFYEIISEILETEDNEIFEFIASKLQMFLKNRQLERDPMTLVIVFPFPLDYDNAKVVRFTDYTKHFNFKHLKDEDNVMRILESIIRHINPRVELVAMVNEASAVLMAGSWKYSNCEIGLFLGSSSSSVAFKEKIENVPTTASDLCLSKPWIISHLDWGVFGENACLDHIRQELDIDVDKLSNNPRKRIYEKLICGEFVAELARQIFLICTKENILFSGDIGKQLIKPFSFNSRHICEVLSESAGNFDNTRLMFDRLGIMKPSDKECSKARFILECLTKRSAALLAAGCACLLDKSQEPRPTIAIEGTFYGNNSVHLKFVSEYLEQLIGQGKTFDLQYVDDAVGIGAAMLAAVTEQEKYLYQAREESESDVGQSVDQSVTNQS
ncbi:hexokinase type 2-like [Musca autumnalis]|uniref:hexokinase type 2-like n=1 Tax=Musca autumnalis TaxID=221902 RepID=UPI003CF525FD